MSQPAETNSLQSVGLLALIVLLCGAGIQSIWSSQPLLLMPLQITKRTDPYTVPYPKYAGCGYLLNTGSWTDVPVVVRGNCTEQHQYSSCGIAMRRRWQFSSDAIACGARHYDVDAARELLQTSWVACVGDSISRFLCAALMRALHAPADSYSFGRHADFTRDLDPGIQLTFHWAPFPTNASEVLMSWTGSRKPDLVLLTSALWHMLHVADAGGYTDALHDVRQTTADAVLGDVSEARPMEGSVLVATSSSETYPPRMLSAEKRRRMTPAAVDAYNEAFVTSGLLAEKGPYGLLDMFSMTHGCGMECSVDGVHSQPDVYDAAVQVLLNIYERCRGDAGCWVA